MARVKRISKKTLCIILSIIMIVGTITVVFTTERFQGMLEAKNFLSSYTEHIISTKHVIGLDKDSMADNKIIALKNSNGSITSYGFSEPVTFKDESGQLRAKEISIIKQKNKILKEKGFDYTNGDNDYRVNISSDIRNGVNTEFNKAAFTMIPNVSVKEEKTNISTAQAGMLHISPIMAGVSPINLSVSGQVVENKKDDIVSFQYDEAYGEGTYLSVEPQLNGVNQKIVLSRTEDVSNISFTIVSENCTPVIQEDGCIQLVNNESKQVTQVIETPVISTEDLESDFVIGDVFGRGSYTLNENEDGSHSLGITVPEGMNMDISEYGDLVVTVPVIAATNATGTTTGHISPALDTGIYTGTPSTCYNNEVLSCFGRDSGYGYGRALTHFTKPAAITLGATIHYAFFWARECTGETSSTYVQPYIVNDTWNSQTTWATRPGFMSTTTMTRKNINSASTDMSGNPYWYKFSIYQAVNAWVKGVKPNRGIIFRSEEETNHNYRWRAFATKEYTTSSMRPYTVINYTNDTTAPTLTSVSGNPTAWTNNNVTLTVNGAADEGAGLHASAYSFSTTQGSYAWQASNQKAFSSNGTVYIYLRDALGNIALRKTVVINKIDKTAPLTPSVSINPNTTAQSVTLTASSSDTQSGLHATAYSFSTAAGVYNWQAANTKEFTSNGTVYVYVRDAVGNISAVKTVLISNVDNEAPTATVTVTENSAQNTVTLTINNATDNLAGLHSEPYSFSDLEEEYTWQSQNSKTFDTNKTVYIYGRDTLGNIGLIDTINITSIICDSPIIKNIEIETNANGKTINIDAEDDLNDTIFYSFDNGTTWQEQSSKTYTDTISSVAIKVKDVHENISNTQTVNVLNDLFYRDDQMIGIASESDILYKVDSGNWSNYTKPFSISAFTSADVYAKFYNSNVTYKQTFASNNYEENAYIEVNADFCLNYKSVSFAFDRIYSSYTGDWFCSIESAVNTTANSNLLEVILPDSSKVPFVKIETNKYINVPTGYELEQTTTGYTVKTADIVYKYDTDGKLSVITNKYSDEITITRTASAVIIADETNRAYTINLDSGGVITSITDPAGNSITYTMSGGYLSQVTDQAGVIIGQYAYSNGRLSKSMDKTITYDSHGRVTQYLYDSSYHEDITYDDTLNKVSTATSSDNSTSVTFNDAYLPVENVDESGSISAYTYDSDYNVLTETVDGETTTNSYNSAGLLISSSDSEGVIALYTYDSDGNLIRENQQGDYTYYVYNSFGDVSIQAVLQEDYEGDIPTVYSENLECFDVTEYEYGAGLVTLMEDSANDETTEYAYDVYGNVASVTITADDGEQTAISVTNSTYDVLGNVLTVCENEEISSFVYDGAGRTLRSNNAGEVTRILYDTYGRTIREISPEDYNSECDGLNLSQPQNTYSNSSAGKRYVYNSDFTLASETNSLDVTTTYTYDSVTGTKSIEEFDIYTYYYLPHGEVSRVEADGELVVRYEYNSKYEVTLEAHSEPPQQSGGGDYSGEGSEPPRNQDIIYTYNSAGQLVSQTRASELTPYLTYTYTDGELSEKLNLDSGLRYVYTDDTIYVYKDSTNELLYYYENTSEENSNVSSSSETHFGTSVSGESGEDYSWQQIGDNNSHYSFTENSAGYITAEQIKYNDATVLSASCIYDNSGNITSKSYSGIATYQNTFDSEGRKTSSSKSATGNLVNQYFYDAQDQLVRVNSAERGYTCAYTYDTRGNITSKKYYSYTTAESLEGLTPTHQDTFAYSTTREDQLVSYNNNYYTYDDRGYLTSDGTHYFDWANGRQLVSVGSDIAYTYDENGIRTTKEVDGTTTYFNTSDGVILSQSDDTNTLIFQYDNGGLPVGFTWNGTQYYYLTNSSGDVLGICDTSGELLVEYTYDEWGKLIDLGISANADEDLAEINPLRYRGYYYDEETGFYYLQSRYYNPDICRFISQDSYTNTETGTSLQYNMFAYCENDPVNYDDPTGKTVYINITSKLNNAMINHAKELFKYGTKLIDKAIIRRSLFKTIKNISRAYANMCKYFYKKVKTKGDWDLKNNKSWGLKKGYRYKYNKKYFRHDDIGNIHFGFVGSVLFPTRVLQAGAGAYQIYSGTSSYKFVFSYFDDPEDTKMIKYGSNIFKSSEMTTINEYLCRVMKRTFHTSFKFRFLTC